MTSTNFQRERQVGTLTTTSVEASPVDLRIRPYVQWDIGRKQWHRPCAVSPPCRSSSRNTGTSALKEAGFGLFTDPT